MKHHISIRGGAVGCTADSSRS